MSYISACETAIYRDTVKLSYQFVLHELNDVSKIRELKKLKQEQYIQLRNQERIYNKLLRTKYDNYYNYLLQNSPSEKNYIITKTNVLITLTEWIKNDDTIITNSTKQVIKATNHTKFSRLPKAIIFHILSYNISEGCFPNEHELPTTDFLTRGKYRFYSIPVGPSIYGIPYGVWKMYRKCEKCMCVELQPSIRTTTNCEKDNCIVESFDIPIWEISKEYDFLMHYGNKKHTNSNKQKSKETKKTNASFVIIQHQYYIKSWHRGPIVKIDPITFCITENIEQHNRGSMCYEKGLNVLGCSLDENNLLYTTIYNNTLKNETTYFKCKRFAVSIDDKDTMKSLAFVIKS